MIQSWYPDEEAKFSEDFSLASRLELIAMRCYQWWWLGKITKDISWSRKMIVVNNNLLGVFLSSLVAEGFHFFFFPQWSNFINSTPKLFTRVLKIVENKCMSFVKLEQSCCKKWQKSSDQETDFWNKGRLKVLNDNKLILNDQWATHAHIGPICCHSEPSVVPYYPNQLGLFLPLLILKGFQSVSNCFTNDLFLGLKNN